MKAIQEISIVGMGLVGQTLARYFSEKGIKIKQIVARKPFELYANQFDIIDKLESLKPVDLVLVCVKDAALLQVASQISKQQFTAYTSGGIGLEQFVDRDNLAVFYPLQSFAHLEPTAVSKIPILIEAQNEELKQALHIFALEHFEVCQEMNSEKRAKLHLAAVFANNFTNHIIHLAQKQCELDEVPFELLKPLIAETARKWMTIPANQLQTGPAARKDNNVIDKHESLLSGDLLAIYQLLTKSIMTNNNQF